MDKTKAQPRPKKAAEPAGGKASPDTRVQRKSIDWETLETQYRAGIRSLKDIGREFGVSDAAIIKRAKRDGWVRDLRAKIQAKADAKVSESLVSAEVSAETKIRERDVIEANATAVAEVRLAHRKDIHRARRLTASLFDELEQQTKPETLEGLRTLGELLANPDEKTGRDRMNEVYQAVISLPERSKTLKVLTESLQKTVDMERQAFNMDKQLDTGEGDALSKLLMKLATGNGNGFSPVPNDPERASVAGTTLSPTEPEDDD
jgi:hypothetical protein